jgi:DNA repair exonuclease SbcCD ATPase subunit
MPEAQPGALEEEVTGRWKTPPDVEEQEEPLPDSPARLRRLFYDTLLELSEHVAQEGAASEEMAYGLSSLNHVREEAARIASESGVTENRFEDIRRELRERESTLRYAIIDLNLAKADMQEKGSDEEGLKEIEYQISELERSLADLESQRSERFAALNDQLQKNREQLKAMEQEMAVHYRRLYAYLEDARADIATEEARSLYRLLERCRASLTQATITR